MKRLRKLNNPIKIRVNNKPIKILRFTKERYFDDLNDEVIKVIELVTEIPHEILDEKEIRIDLKGERPIEAIWIMHLSQPGEHSYLYRVTD